MKRWAAILFDIAAKDSLLLCAAAVGLWVWSYSRAPTVEYEDITSKVIVVVSLGKLGVVQALRIDSSVPDQYFAPQWTLTTRLTADLSDQVRAGFPDAHAPVVGIFVGHTVQDNIALSAVVIPMPLVVAVFALLPLLALVRRVRRLRRLGRIASGCCAACGYDLRASPGRCPECGRRSDPLAAKKKNFTLTS